jgi:hypothetical protein
MQSTGSSKTVPQAVILRSVAISRYAARSQSPRALADGRMLVLKILLKNRKNVLKKKFCSGIKGSPFDMVDRRGGFW